MPVKHKIKALHIPWPVIADGLSKLGHWNLIESSSRRKIFERRNERIVAIRLGPDRWKAEYSVNDRLEDMSGMAEEEYIKRIVLEMGVHLR
jgi:hypothetical protein